jgi:hypothetical protein
MEMVFVFSPVTFLNTGYGLNRSVLLVIARALKVNVSLIVAWYNI